MVNRNGGEALFHCLESLVAQTGPSLEVVVVDNASAPEERETITRRFPAVRLVRFSRNLGFAAGANEGILRAAAPFLLLVNNDARVAPDYTAKLLARMEEDEKLAAAQGVVWRPGDRTVDTAGLSWNERGEAVPLWRGRNCLPAGAGAFEISGVSATAALYRRTALEEVSAGGHIFDNSFFAYYEDVDLALRLSRAGWRSLLDPSAEALHTGSMTGSRTPWRRSVWTARNRWRTLLKNFDHAFLRARLGTLLRADLAHARSLGLPGAALLAAVWPRAFVSAAWLRPRTSALTSFPPTAVFPR